jgi:hypothetical protein
MLYNIKQFEDFFRPTNEEYLKVFLVLYFVGFTSLKDLEFSFNISSKIVRKAIDILDQEQLIKSHYFFGGGNNGIGLEVQDIIRKINGGFIDKIENNPKIYTLLELAEDPILIFQNKLKNLFQENESLRFTMGLILTRLKSLSVIYETCQDKEELNECLKRLNPNIFRNPKVLNRLIDFNINKINVNINININEK